MSGADSVTPDERLKCPWCGSPDHLGRPPWPAGPDYWCSQCNCHFDMFADGPGAILPGDPSKEARHD